MNSLLGIFAFILIKLAAGEDLFVDLPNGRIQGKIEQTQFSNKTYYAFYSVRYAEPPLGKLRFQAPVEVKPWATTYNATYERSDCFQVPKDYPDESEDCLFLNIFSPKKPQGDPKLPVMVFLHGGGFNQGSGQVRGGHGPDFFMEHDVLLVTINYRLGPFGFLSTGDGVIPGNAGLKDVHLGLKWINSNIRTFGGDPEKVTLFGYSAGAAAVSYQLLNPQSFGLFRAVILQGGSSINPWACQRNQVEITYKTAAYLESSFNDTANWNSTVLWDLLQKADARDIDAASKAFSDTHPTGTLQIQQGFFYGPVVETHNNAPFVTKLPFDSLQKGDYLRVPAIVGTNAEESLYLFFFKENFNATLGDFDEDVKLLVPGGLHISDKNASAYVGRLIKREYSPELPFRDNFLAGIKFHSEQDFTKSLIETATLQASRSPVYFYEFTYHGAMGDHNLEFPGSGNVSHVEDQTYLFSRIMHSSKQSNANLSQFSEDDVTVHRRYMKLLVNFATHLDPTPAADNLLQNVRWPLVKDGDFRYLDIGRDLSVKKDLKKARMDFWEGIYEDYGVGPFETF